MTFSSENLGKSRTIYGSLAVLCIAVSAYTYFNSPVTDSIPFLIGNGLPISLIATLFFMATTNKYRTPLLVTLGFLAIYASTILTSIAHANYVRWFAKDMLSDLTVITGTTEASIATSRSDRVPAGDEEYKTNVGRLMADLKNEGEAILKDYQVGTEALNIKTLMDQNNQSFEANLGSSGSRVGDLGLLRGV